MVYPSKQPTNLPQTNSMSSPTLDLVEFPVNAICNNLLDAYIRLDDISLNECINLCKNVSLTECKMINYFDDSRCYLFDELCSMSNNVENSINSSHIWYKNQLTKQYCMDYRNYLDLVGDSCQYYTDYGWCDNNAISDQHTIDEFEQLQSKWTAIEACCQCGGGKLVADSISVAYIDNNNINQNLLECSFKEEQQENMTNIRNWNNFAAFDLSQYINQQLPTSFDSNLLVFNQIESNNIYSISICDFGEYQHDDGNNNNITNAYFIMLTINDKNRSHLLLNSEFFDMDESILSSAITTTHHSYRYCLHQIQDSIIINAQINGILPCWNQYSDPTLKPTAALLHHSTADINATSDSRKDVMFLDFWTKIYGVACGGIIFLIFVCIICYIYRNKKRQKAEKQAAESKANEVEITIYSDDHFAIHRDKKRDNILPSTMSASFLISSSSILDVNDETKPILMFEHENKEREPGSEGHFDLDGGIEAMTEKKEAGKLIVQHQYYNANQMKYINHKCCKRKSRNGEYGYILFGDNDIDRDRGNGIGRIHFGGQAAILGIYDRKMGYGIITTFKERNPPNLDEFKPIMNALFIPLQKHLANGYDVIYPYPTKKDLINHRDRYYLNGKQIIHHNIGTGRAFQDLSIAHLEYIQVKLKELQHFASKRINVDYYYYNPTKDSTLTVYKIGGGIEEKQEEKEEEKEDEKEKIYFCPSCSEEKHHLIKFKNCNHRMCEECLSGYIVYDMQYDQETERERFLCYAHTIGKCQALLCIDDIKYSQDRCKCDECKRNNTDSGNGTILSDNNYNMFKNIILSFDAKLECWDKDICPNIKCKKPFVVRKPYQFKERTESETYQISMEQIINENHQQIDHCNCCGQIRLIHNNNNNNNNNDNICGVCNYWYCNNCRINCFYKIDTNFTQQPAKHILSAFIKFNQKLIKNDGKNDGKNKKKNITFEICEICWYNYYCHICPHCNYIFCGQCDIEWNGNRVKWLDGNKNIKKKHDLSSKHKCIKHKEKLEKQSIHKHLIRINKHREKLSKINLENQQKDDIIIQKEAENFKLIQKMKEMEYKITELKMENQEKENMVLSKHLTITTRKQKEAEQKLQDIKYINIWQWRDDDNKWKSYNKEEMDKIETLKIGQIYSFSFKSQNYSIHKLSIDRGLQTNTKTKKNRNVRRIKIEKEFNGIQYPEFWKMNNYYNYQKEGDESIDDKYTIPILIELDLNNDEIAKKVKKDFYLSVDVKYKIIKIECVQNRYLWDKYYTQKQSMKKSIGLNKLNELNLWHGTHVDIIDKITKQGFRKEYTTTSRFGEGTYFAKNASYSVNNRYCKSNNNIFKLFQCRVLCGESYLGSNNIKLKNWPIKKNKNNQQIYDSLVNNIKNPSIYVIHDDNRVYPMFIVHFKTN